MNNLLFTIITFYQFKKIANLDRFQTDLKDFCKFNKIRGTIIIAKEGINGTVAATEKEIKLLESLFLKKGFNNLQPKYSYYKYMPFSRLKVRLKKEIVTFRSNNDDPQKITGKHIDAKDWNNLILKKDTILVDVRNDFEHKVGSFKGAINPKTKNFTEFKKFVNESLKNFKQKKIAMFCTGGIRCEKASVYLEKKGFNKVFQLKGGIINYLKKIKKNKSLWKGECYVFDNRISLKHGLVVGTYSMCSGCRKPISIKDKKSLKYEEGVSCPNCHDTLTNSQKERFRMRQKQINVAKKLGKKHIFQKEF